MNASIISQNNQSITVQVTIPLHSSMLESEISIQRCLNEMGVIATGEALKQFDTDGEPLIISGTKWTVRKITPTVYHTPYGDCKIERFAYQTSKGGRNFIPLNEHARIIQNSTPLFAKQVTSKYAQTSKSEVVKDMKFNHGRYIGGQLVESIFREVGIQASLREEQWNYKIPELAAEVACIAIGRDGTTVRYRDDGFKETMVGSITLYDNNKNRLHTIYLAAPFESGKENFNKRFEKEIEKVKQKYPGVKTVGLADGAEDNWIFLEEHTDTQTLDFYHAAGYVKGAAWAAFPRKDQEEKRKEWNEEKLHLLKHGEGGAEKLLKEFEELQVKPRLGTVIQEKVNAATTYFINHHHQMSYPENLAEGIPIGSGVTEAACKVVVKRRMCGSGMGWTHYTAGRMLCIRGLCCSTGRWEDFWIKVDRRGFMNANEGVALAN